MKRALPLVLAGIVVVAAAHACGADTAEGTAATTAAPASSSASGGDGGGGAGVGGGGGTGASTGGGGATGGGGGTGGDPGCPEVVPPTPSPCNQLGKRDCVETAGCHAIFHDFCATPTTCSKNVEFAACVAVDGTAAVGPCTSLVGVECASRDDCIAEVQRDTGCCPQPPWGEGFLQCQDEPVPNVPTCSNLSEDACIAADGCAPTYQLESGVAVCGPLQEPADCPACWLWYFAICVDSWAFL
jgi:hypothetical protein